MTTPEQLKQTVKDLQKETRELRIQVAYLTKVNEGHRVANTQLLAERERLLHQVYVQTNEAEALRRSAAGEIPGRDELIQRIQFETGVWPPPPAGVPWAGKTPPEVNE